MASDYLNSGPSTAFASNSSSLSASPVLRNRKPLSADDSISIAEGSTSGMNGKVEIESSPEISRGSTTRSSISRNVIEGLQLNKLGERMAKLPQMELPDIKMLGQNIEVQFAPLSIPLQRRTQTAVVAFWSGLLFLCTIVFLFLCSIPLFWPLVIPYLIFMYLDKAPSHGGRVSMSNRRSIYFKHFAGYYPVSLIKEADLAPTKPYVFGYHPHGIIGTGAFVNFATDATGFSEKFPGIKPYLLTLTSNFKIPFYRDILLSLGVCSVSKKSCSNILRKGPGHTIIIVVGGAAESLAAHPGTNDLTLKKRLGFIKMAVKEGADLVPVFSFGENDIYEQLANNRGTTVYKIQKKFQKMFGFTLPLFHGRGLFNYNLGLMPFRHPIVSVVGRPIHVKQNLNPSNEELGAYQEQYIDELMRIWDRYKDVYARNRTRELRVVE